MPKDYDYGQLLDDFELGADVMPGESLTDYIERRRNEKADGGSIGIEVLFGPKREDFNIGGQAQKKNTTPYDSRASILDYGAALDKVGAGTQAQKSQSLGQYAKNYFTGLGEAGLKKLNPSVRSLAASYGVGKPISKFSDLGPEVGQALQGAIMNTIKNSQQRNPTVNSDISLKNIPVSSYTSYFKDRGAANTAGLYDTGYNSITDQLKDMSAALAGDASAIARTTYGRFNVDIDPEARTGLIRDRYDFEKNMPGSTAYGINMALPQKFVDEILNSPEYQKATGYKPPQTRTPLSESDFYSQFYGVPYKGFEGKSFKTLQADDPNYDEIRRSSSAGSFANLVDRGLIQAYTGPTDYKNYLSTFAEGGRVGLFMGGPALEGQALNIYNSMNSYGFTDQQIADALQGQGLYTPSGSGTPETTAPNIINQQLQTGGGGDNNFGGQGIGSFGNLDPNTKKTMQVEVADGKGGVMIKEVDTYLDAGGMRKTLDNKNPVNAGLDIKTPGIAIFESLFGKKTDDKFLEEGKILGPFNNPNYKDLSFFGKIKADASRQKELKQLQKEFELQEQLKKQIAKEEADRAAQYGATNYGRGSDGQQSYDFGTGFGASATTGGPVSNRSGRGRTDYKDGGLATMFTRKR